MIKEYSQNRNNVIMNFSLKYCNSGSELLKSDGFKKVLVKYIEKIKKSDSLLLDNIVEIVGKDQNLEEFLIETFKLLLVFEKEELVNASSYSSELLCSGTLLFDFIEGFYNYWRSLERYAVIQSYDKSSGIESEKFIESNNNFSNLILKTYRKIEENIIGNKHNVYRQLTAGVNAGMVLMKNRLSLPSGYSSLNKINVIKRVVFTPPFIIYPKKNTRSGIFKEVYSNPIEDLNIRNQHYFCFPAKVGDSLAYIYFHRDFMNHGISLCNLFELATMSDIKDAKPDLIVVFGAKNKELSKETVFYHDKDNDIVTGYVSGCDDVDYFGYMKKMILTVHNVRMINKGFLPIHGAMVNVTLKNRKKVNIAIIGDSGAGKSESLEAFRRLSEKYLKDMKVVFDDMGSFKIIDDKIYGYGTEIGAFVRLDDLEMGYSFQEMDRAIFMNPHRINARLILPISNYETIVKGYPVDIVLYANNYEDIPEVLKQFNDKDNAIEVFKKGRRKAKGTTSELGLVESYFANPFGPMQRKEQTNIIIDKVFTKLFEQKVFVGEICTKLAINGYEHTGPEAAAKKLLELVK